MRNSEHGTTYIRVGGDIVLLALLEGLLVLPAQVHVAAQTVDSQGHILVINVLGSIQVVPSWLGSGAHLVSGPYRVGPASGENRSHLCRLRWGIKSAVFRPCTSGSARRPPRTSSPGTRRSTGSRCPTP